MLRTIIGRGLGERWEEITSLAWVVVLKSKFVGESQDDWKHKDKYSVLSLSIPGRSSLEVVMSAHISIKALSEFQTHQGQDNKEISHIQASISIDGWLNYLGPLMNE